MPKRNPSTPYAVPALEHGLDVLELVLGADEALSQKQIADRTGKPTSTVFRLLNCLERRGFVQRNPDTGNYQPTLRLYGLAQLQPVHQRFRDIAAAPMRRLSQAIGESCHLSILDDGQVRILCNQPSPHTHSLDVQPGSVYSALETTAGRLLLAHLPEAQAQAIMASRGLGNKTSKAQRQAFAVDLKALRTRGECIAESSITPGVLDVDVLIPCAALAGGVVLAVPCLKKWTRREQKETLMPAVRSAAQEIAELFNPSRGDPAGV